MVMIVTGVERLVAIRVARKRDQLARPRLFFEPLAESLDDVDLDDDLSFEIRSCAEAEVRMGRTRVAVGARVEAPAIGIHTPPKPDVGALVLRERALGALLVNPQVRRRRLTRPLEIGFLESIGRIVTWAGH